MSWLDPFMKLMAEKNRKFQDEQLARRGVATTTQPSACTLHGSSPRQPAQCNHPCTTSRRTLFDGPGLGDPPLRRAAKHGISTNTSGSSDKQPTPLRSYPSTSPGSLTSYCSGSDRSRTVRVQPQRSSDHTKCDGSSGPNLRIPDTTAGFRCSSNQCFSGRRTDGSGLGTNGLSRIIIQGELPPPNPLHSILHQHSLNTP